MAREEVKNKIITVDAILKIAELLENERLHYLKLGMYNDKLNYYTKDDVNVYHVYNDEVSYAVELKSGERVEKDNIEWLKSQLTDRNLPSVDIINLTLGVGFSSTRSKYTAVNSTNSHCNLNVYIRITEENVEYSVGGDNMEDEVYKLHSDIAQVFDSCENRYNKTMKRRLIRSECLSLTIGFLIAYIALIVVKIKYDNLPDAIHKLLNSSIYSYVITFFIIALGAGNVLGQAVSAFMYKGIAPKKKYSHYNGSSGRNVYVDNIADFLANNEVQIGRFHNARIKRAKIEKVFKITSIIVLLQVIAAVIYCVAIGK